MKHYLFKQLLALGLIALPMLVAAEDTDLFVGVAPSGSSAPNLMIIIDNGANFSSSAPISASQCTIGGAVNSLSGSAGGIEQCALYNVINNITANDTAPSVNIGMMVYNGSAIRDVSGLNCGEGSGGCLIQPLIPITVSNKTKLLAFITSWRTSGGSGNGYIKASASVGGNANAMQETWAYITGHTGLSGRSYAAIKPTGTCQKNYVVFLGNAYNNASNPGDAAGPQSALNGTNAITDANANPTATSSQKALILDTITTSCGSFTLPSSNHESKGYYQDEWAGYMFSQNIITYTVGVISDPCAAPAYAAILSSTANKGTGTYFEAQDYTKLTTIFQTILSEVYDVNSVFAAVSLPVSVNTQGTYFNQVFIGMFRPDADAKPRWAGNLKQYKFGFPITNDSTGARSTTLKLIDANEHAAISSGGSGFIAPCARSFWTSLNTDTYWAFKKQGTCLASDGTSLDASDSPDGNIVEKGAQATTLRKTTARNMYTCDGTTFSTCTSLTNFNTTSSSTYTAMLAAGLDVATINWHRGQDVDNENTSDAILPTPPPPNSTASIVVRPSVHSDVVHSRPVAINFNTDPSVPQTSPAQVVVFYGTNDGVLHAINGNRSADIGTVTAGSELWSFVAPEYYSKIKRLRDNSPLVKFSTSNSSTATPKDYGFDGAITAYQDTTDTYIYATMRRGGRILYAFRVPNANPSSPVFLWKRGCPNLTSDAQCTVDVINGDFTGIGQTWSSAKIFKSSGYTTTGTPATFKPLIIMGGGYDNCEDSDPNIACSSSSKGAKIYVIDAVAGNIVKTFNTSRSVVGDVFVVPDTTTGLIKYAYATDMGANIYRISGATANSAIGTTAPADWTMTKIATLGGTGTENRKFMFTLDVVQDTDGAYDLMLGSGDREKPLNSYTSATNVKNYFFMIKDNPTIATWLSEENTTRGNCGADILCLNSLLAIAYNGATPTTTDLNNKKGWYLALAPKEQVVTSAITVFDTITFSTQIPAVYSAGTCTPNLGIATVYNLNRTTGSSTVGTVRGEIIAGGGLPPSPVAGLVRLDDGSVVPIILGSSPTSPLEVKQAVQTSSVIQPRARVYWYIQQ